MAKVSVIVPVYNSEQYLIRCLDSLVNQTLKDMEIICINDGSTDSSLDILGKYEKDYNHIKVYSQSNQGLVAARKKGVSLATGNFIGYVDSDDWVEEEMYEQMLVYAEKENADIVTCGYFLEGNYTTKHLDNVEEGLYAGETIGYLRDNTIYNYSKKETGLRGSLWSKLFKREIIELAQNSVPDNITIAEDKLCVLRAILEGERVYVLKKPLYHWEMNYNSMSRSDDYSYLGKIDNVYKYLVGIYEHKNFTKKMRSQAELYIVELLTLGINNRMGFSNKYLLRVDPYWLEQVNENSRLVIYGGGDLEEQYVTQVHSRGDLTIVKQVGFAIDEIPEIETETYDYILIAIKNKDKATEVINKLKEKSISEDKLLWFEQPEFYWKYARVQGIIE
ncbi:MAG: glycosyltransferase [Lachnospiraceae bacterium]|nr:glycosyltransferase [Lachnospiraceae bacterium]